jgi:hypothetical protein
MNNLVTDLVKSATKKVKTLPKEALKEARFARVSRQEEADWAKFEDKQDHLDLTEVK